MAAVRPLSTARPAAFSPGGPAPITITSNSPPSAIEVPPHVSNDQIRHQAGPPRLVRGSQALPRVAVEVFMERDHAVPGRVPLELLVGAEHRPPPRGGVVQE